MEGRAELARRVAELDDGPWYRRGEPTLLDDLSHVIEIVERITSAGTASDFKALPRASAAEADAIVSSSRVLARLEEALPEIVTGPLCRDTQYWMNGGTSGRYRARREALDQAHFVGALDAPEIELSTKPFFIGLFTCTGVLGTYGMWRLYLERYRGGAGPTDYERPWETWAVEPEPDARVLEIASATHWVDFVTAYPRWGGRMLFPDWRAVAQHHDAVHMTLRAIMATQGIFFPTDTGEVVPTFWDVESTFWLRWCFRSAQLVELS